MNTYQIQELEQIYKNGEISTEKLYFSHNPLENYMQNKRYSKLVKLINKYSNEYQSFIDMGCGVGTYIASVNQNKRILGMDLNRQDLKIARKYNKNFVQASIEDLPFKKQALEFVLFSETVEHLQKNTRSFENIYNVLKPDGILLISTPSKKGIYEIKEYVYIYNFVLSILRLITGKKAIIPYKEHISLYQTEELKNILMQNGFSIVEEYHTGFCIPLSGDFLKILMKFKPFIKLYEYIDNKANSSNLLREYNWSIILLCKKI